MSEDERDFRKSFNDMYEMVKVLYNEKTTRFQGEISNHPKGNGSDGRKPPPPPPPSPPSSPPSSPPPSPKGHAKSHFLKLDVKFELPTYNGEVNAEKLNNLVHQIEFYCRIQRLVMMLQRSNLLLFIWEARTQEDFNKSGKIISYWNDFIATLRRQFYPLAYMQKEIMDWKNFRQVKG